MRTAVQPETAIMSAWQFKPKLMPTVAVMLLFPALLALGFWQLDRAAQQAARYSQYQDRRNMEPLDLDTAPLVGSNTGTLLWRRVSIRGIYDGATHYLLDNQVLNGQAGYLVYTPLRLVPGEIRVLVNRGWLPADADRSQLPRLPTPAGVVSLDGLIKDVPVTGILLSGDTWEDLAGGMVRVQNVDLNNIARNSGHQFLPFIIRLDAVSEAGFERHWNDPGSGREKHLGYAFQWFLMSVALIIIYLAVNLKKTAQPHA